MMTDPARRKAEMIVAAARDHKAFDLVLLDIAGLTNIADFFFICSCRSSRQVQAVAEHIQEEMKKSGGWLPLGVEGRAQGHWALLDYGDVVAHVFYEPQRHFYDLESLWADAPRVELASESEPPTRRTGRGGSR